MRKTCLLLLPLLCAGCVTYVMYGVPVDLDLTVIDAESNAPIPGVACRLIHPESGNPVHDFGSTDASGTLCSETTIALCRRESIGMYLPTTPKHDYILQLSHTAYQDKTISGKDAHIVHSGVVKMQRHTGD